MGIKKTEIAVCLSGLIRHWDSTAPLFEYWNQMYEDVNFTFFVSTWTDGDEWYEKERHGELKIKSINFDKYPFIEKWSKHSPNEVELFPNKNPNANYYSFAIEKVQELRKGYEQENGFEFDAVMQTRNDIFIGKDMLDRCVQLARQQPYFFDENSIFTNSDISTIKVADNTSRIILQQDNFAYGTSKMMDKYAKMYQRCVVEKTVKSRSLHYIQGEHIHRERLQQYKILGGSAYLFRAGKLVKDNRPHPDVMLKLIKENGAKWVYEQNLKTLSSEYFVYK